MKKTGTNSNSFSSDQELAALLTLCFHENETLKNLANEKFLNWMREARIRGDMTPFSKRFLIIKEGGVVKKVMMATGNIPAGQEEIDFNGLIALKAGLNSVHEAQEKGKQMLMMQAIEPQSPSADIKKYFSSETINKELIRKLTALHKTVINKDNAKIDELLKIKGIDVNQKAEDEMTALHFAVAANDVEIVKKLLAVPNIKVDTQNIGKMSVFHDAAYMGQEAMVRLLLEKSDCNLVGPDGFTALHMAVQQGHVNIIKILSKAPKINLNARNSYGETILHIAIEKMDTLNAVLAIEGIEVDALQSQFKFTALHKASALNDFEAVKALLLKGARFDIESQGLQAIDLANPRSENGQKIIKLLKANQRLADVKRQVIQLLNDQEIDTKNINFALSKYGEKTGIIVVLSSDLPNGQTIKQQITFAPECDVLEVAGKENLPSLFQPLKILSESERIKAAQLRQKQLAKENELAKKVTQISEYHQIIGDKISQIKPLLPSQSLLGAKISFDNTQCGNLSSHTQNAIAIYNEICNPDGKLRADEKIKLGQKFFGFMSMMVSTVRQEEGNLSTNSIIQLKKSGKSEDEIKKIDQTINDGIANAKSIFGAIQPFILREIGLVFAELEEDFNKLKSDDAIDPKTKLGRLELINSNLSNISQLLSSKILKVELESKVITKIKSPSLAVRAPKSSKPIVKIKNIDDEERRIIADVLLLINGETKIKLSTEHGRNAENPYIVNKSFADNAKEQLTTDLEKLKQKLGSDIPPEISQDLINIVFGLVVDMAGPEVCSGQSGAHNKERLVRKILPPKSPISDEEKPQYVKPFQDIVNAINAKRQEEKQGIAR